jgi:hypothetical protein
MKNRAAAYTIDGDAINKVRVPDRLMGTYGSGKEAERIWLNSRETQPANTGPDTAGLAHWRESYRELWKFKIAFEEQHNR